MIYWASLGVFFKAPGWAIGFILLAKGKAKLFFWNEVIAIAYFLGLNLLGYYFWGLSGLGISYLIGYFLYSLQMFFLSQRKFEFSFSGELIRIFVLQFLLAIGSFLVVKFLKIPLSYPVGIILIAISGWYSFKELDKRLGVRSILLELKDRYFKKKQ